MADTASTVNHDRTIGIALQSQIFHESKTLPRPIPHLMPWLLDRRNLVAAWERVRGAEGAATPGIDGVTCPQLQPRLQAWLQELADDLHHHSYQPQLPRWVEIPKSTPGKFRRLGIMTVKDRVVHAALKQVLEPLLEPGFLSCSFGFRPGRSVASALQEAADALSGNAYKPSPFAYAATIDVADCFPSIDHAVVLAELERHVADFDFLGLVRSLLAAGGTAVRRWLFWRPARTRGLIQGSSLSPLLCNLVLHGVDQALVKFHHEHQGQFLGLRYADNLLLLAHSPALLSQGLKLVQRLLGRIHLSLGNADASIVNVSRGFDWLGVRLRPRPFALEDRPVFGYAIPASKVAQMQNRLEEMTAPPSDKIDASVFNLERWIVVLNRQLRDWRQAYLFADNAAEVFLHLDNVARHRLGALLAHITGDRMQRVRQRFRTFLPRGFWTWQVNGVRLSVLSALAPHSPVRHIRRPEWMKGSRNFSPVAPVAANDSEATTKTDHSIAEANTIDTEA